MSRTLHGFGLCVWVFLLMDGLAPWTVAQTHAGAASTSSSYVVGAVNQPGGYILQAL